MAQTKIYSKIYKYILLRYANFIKRQLALLTTLVNTHLPSYNGGDAPSAIAQRNGKYYSKFNSYLKKGYSPRTDYNFRSIKKSYFFETWRNHYRNRQYVCPLYTSPSRSHTIRFFFIASLKSWGLYTHPVVPRIIVQIKKNFQQSTIKLIGLYYLKFRAFLFFACEATVRHTRILPHCALC